MTNNWMSTFGDNLTARHATKSLHSSPALQFSLQFGKSVTQTGNTVVCAWQCREFINLTPLDDTGPDFIQTQQRVRYQLPGTAEPPYEKVV